MATTTEYTAIASYLFQRVYEFKATLDQHDSDETVTDKVLFTIPGGGRYRVIACPVRIDAFVRKFLKTIKAEDRTPAQPRPVQGLSRKAFIASLLKTGDAEDARQAQILIEDCAAAKKAPRKARTVRLNTAVKAARASTAQTKRTVRAINAAAKATARATVKLFKAWIRAEKEAVQIAARADKAAATELKAAARKAKAVAAAAKIAAHDAKTAAPVTVETAPVAIATHVIKIDIASMMEAFPDDDLVSAGIESIAIIDGTVHCVSAIPITIKDWDIVDAYQNGALSTL
jgi:hypothetical protein